jgi:putative intracellular protease/amidase
MGHIAPRVPPAPVPVHDLDLRWAEATARYWRRCGDGDRDTLFERFEALDAVGPYEILAHIPDARVRFVAPDRGLVTDSLGGLTVRVDTRYNEVQDCDVLLVPGGAGAGPMSKDEAFLDWIRRIHAGTAFTTSVCTGSIILAAAGLLTGLDASTHWGAIDELEAMGAHYRTQRVIRQGKIVTSAGVSSGIDMALQLTAWLTDDLTAQAIQLNVEYDPQPPFDAGSLATASSAMVEKARSFWS